MKKPQYLVLLVVVLIIIKYIHANVISQSSIVGTYYINEPRELLGPELPTKQDTLKLFEDNKFHSLFYGWGTYQIKKQGHTEIALKYIDSFGWTKREKETLESIPGKPKPMAYSGGAQLHVKRTLSGDIKIILNPDLGVYYIKE